LELAFPCACLLGAFFFAPSPLPWARSVICQLHPPIPLPLLLACCDGSLFVPQPCRAIWLCVLFIGPGDEPCGPPPALLQAVAYHPPAVGPPAFPVVCLLIIPAEISSLPLPLLLCAFSNPSPSAVR
jgi:hypothetical protein